MYVDEYLRSEILWKAAQLSAVRRLGYPVESWARVSGYQSIASDTAVLRRSGCWDVVQEVQRYDEGRGKAPGLGKGAVGTR